MPSPLAPIAVSLWKLPFLRQETSCRFEFLANENRFRAPGPHAAEKTVCIITTYFCPVSEGCYNLWREMGFSDLRLIGLHSERWLMSAAIGLAGKPGWRDTCRRSPLARHSSSQLLKPMDHAPLSTPDAALLSASIFRGDRKGWSKWPQGGRSQGSLWPASEVFDGAFASGLWAFLSVISSHLGSTAWSLPLGTGFIAALHTFIGQDLKHGVKF